jgi:hypothetical protein
MTQNNFKRNAFAYMTQKALADKSKALTSLDLLLEHPVGIGDHSTGDFYNNLDEALNILVDAEDRLATLDELREVYGQAKSRVDHAGYYTKDEPPF